MYALDTLLTGRTLVQRYHVREIVGRGGFATVYRADDERLGRPVAVKVITYPAPDAATRERMRERFQREARALAALPPHPNLVSILDFGVDPQLGLDFLAMELLEGESVAEHLDRRGRPPLPLALRILRDAAEGISVGHRAGLLHCDVEPGNLFLAREPDVRDARVVVLAFGIAQALAEDAARSRFPLSGVLPCSPAYASPEQLRGDEYLAPATDVFSLGAVGYELLTGEKPFGEDDRIRAPGPTPARTIRELNPEVPPAIEAVVQRAMALNPAARFLDAAALVAALDAAIGGAVAPVGTPAPRPPAAPRPAAPAAPSPLPQPPVGTERRAGLIHPGARPRRRRHSRSRARRAWMLTLAVLVALALIAAWLLGDAEPPPEPTVSTVTPVEVPASPARAGE